MKASVEINIKGIKESIWEVIADIEHSEKNIIAIENIEVIKKPVEGILGLKWRETRVMFGKAATEVMWVTDAVPNKFYKTRAESHGAIYITTLSILEKDTYCVLSMSFEGIAQSFIAKLSSAVFGRMMMKSTEKALLNDLKDIKRIVENNNKNSCFT